MPGIQRIDRGVTDPALELLTDLAPVLDSLGKDEFYWKLAAAVARYMDSGRFLTVRYARYARPEFLVNEAMSTEAVQSYLKNYYRIDPLLRMVRDEATRHVVTFDEQRRNGSDSLFYDVIYRTASIKDELVFMLPTIGGVYTAICVDRARRLFSEAEQLRARLIYPVLARIHSLHTYQTLYGQVGRNLDDGEIATMIQDTEGNILFRNSQWIENADAGLEARLPEVVGSLRNGSTKIDDQFILHWETLDSTNAIAPRGKAVMLEIVSPGFLDLTSGELIDRFAVQNRLTPTERKIVGYTLEGYTPTKIADFLNVSAGTVRNHKHRLYYKLDITTERELFSMMFDSFVSQ